MPVWISSFLHNSIALHDAVIVMLLIIVALLVTLLVAYSTRAEKFEKLYEFLRKESKLLYRQKTTYENELKTFANLMDEITFPIWQRNKHLDIVYCNTRFCEITGEIRENIINKNDIELFRDAKEFATRALKTGQVQVAEQNIVIAGSNTLCQVIEIPISDKNSNFSAKNGTIGFTLNLVELQNTRERLKFNMELQKRLLDSLNSAVAIYGVNQKLEYYNKAFIDLWKLDEDWLRTYPTYGEILEAMRQKRLLPEQSDFASFKRDNINMFTNLIAKKEDYYYLPDGKVVKVIIIPYQNRGLLIYYEDMTSQLSLERSYNTLVSVQRHTLNNLNEAVAVFGEDGKLKLFNPNFADLWGFTESLLRSEPHISRILDEMVSFYNADDAKTFREDFISSLNGREFVENKRIRNDGKILIEDFTPLPDGASLIIYFDITDKENVERSLRAERLAYEEADKIKTNFLGNVSYELRSPLTSIMGFSEIMLAGFVMDLNPKSREYLTAIYESGLKLKHLIDNIIDVSRLDAGYVTLNIQKVPIDAILETTMSLLQEDAHKKNITILMRKHDAHETINCDRLRLQQAIRSLVNYSITMSPVAGVININVTGIKGFTQFEIEDKGIGIPEKDIPLIFDQFYKIQTDHVHTTGIGLYLAKKIIDLHSGFIKVESDLGKGTKFIFNIPAE